VNLRFVATRHADDDALRSRAHLLILVSFGSPIRSLYKLAPAAGDLGSSESTYYEGRSTYVSSLIPIWTDIYGWSPRCYNRPSLTSKTENGTKTDWLTRYPLMKDIRSQVVSADRMQRRQREQSSCRSVSPSLNLYMPGFQSFTSLTPIGYPQARPWDAAELSNIEGEACEPSAFI